MTFVELAIGIGARMAPKNSVISVLSPRITLKVYVCIALLLAFGLVVGALVHHAANLPGVVFRNTVCAEDRPPASVTGGTWAKQQALNVCPWAALPQSPAVVQGVIDSVADVLVGVVVHGCSA